MESIDPKTYKRPNKWLNPYEFLKVTQAHSKSPWIPFEMYKQKYIEMKYKIPSEITLKNMLDRQNEFKSSVVENSKIEDDIPTWKKGYEYKILKSQLNKVL